MSSGFIYGDDERLVAWAEDKIRHGRFRNDAQAIGHTINGELVGVVVYDTFSARSCLVSLASNGTKRWMTHEFAARAMAYPFLQCGFARLDAKVSSTNEQSLRFTRHFGFKEEGVSRQAGRDGEDLILFGMLRRECRFLPFSITMSPAGKNPATAI